jgi:hypothetical protein
MIKSDEYVDASKPLNADSPYADEKCDISSEIQNSQGKKITGLAVAPKINT